MVCHSLQCHLCLFYFRACSRVLYNNQGSSIIIFEICVSEGILLTIMKIFLKSHLYSDFRTTYQRRNTSRHPERDTVSCLNTKSGHELFGDVYCGFNGTRGYQLRSDIQANLHQIKFYWLNYWHNVDNKWYERFYV